MAKRFRLVLGAEQDIPCLARLATLRIKVSKCDHHERQKQASLAVARCAQRLFKSAFRLIQIAAHHLHDTTTIVGGDHVIGTVVPFSELAGTFGTAFGFVEFTEPSKDNGSHHVAEHEKGPPCGPRRHVFWRAGEPRARPRKPEFRIAISASEKIGLAEAVLRKAKPGSAVQLIYEPD